MKRNEKRREEKSKNSKCLIVIEACKIQIKSKVKDLILLGQHRPKILCGQHRLIIYVTKKTQPYLCSMGEKSLIGNVNKKFVLYIYKKNLALLGQHEPKILVQTTHKKSMSKTKDPTSSKQHKPKILCKQHKQKICVKNKKSQPLLGNIGQKSRMDNANKQSMQKQKTQICLSSMSLKSYVSSPRLSKNIAFVGAKIKAN